MLESKRAAAGHIAGRPLPIALAKGADHAIFGRGTGVDRDRHARAPVESVGVPATRAACAVPVRIVVGAAVNRQIGAQIAAKLDAGVRAGNVEKSRAVKGTDL